MGWRASLLATIAVPFCLVAELLPIRPYTTADGLAGDRINKIVVDSRGFVWFCTPEGLSRFDGHRFVSFGVAEGLPSRSVNTLLETRSGAYLVATVHGLSEFQAEGGGSAFATYLPSDNPRENNITSLMQDSAGRIWCGTSAGLFEMLSGPTFRRQSLTVPAVPKKRIEVTDLLEDATHRLWVATTSGIFIVSIMGGGGVQYMTVEDGLPNEWVEALLLDSQGRLWAATRGGLALMRDGNKGDTLGVQQAYRESGELKHINVTALT
jgi:ligand-binding sensor domain-containing protein